METSECLPSKEFVFTTRGVGTLYDRKEIVITTRTVGETVELYVFKGFITRTVSETLKEFATLTDRVGTLYEVNEFATLTVGETFELYVVKGFVVILR